MGVSSQEYTPALPSPVLAGLGFAGELQKFYLLDQGMEFALPGDMTLRATAFLNAYRDLSFGGYGCAKDTNFRGLDELRGMKIDCAGSSRSYGAEVFLRRPLTQRLSGWISYTLMRATILTEGRQYSSPSDRRHTVNALVGYDFGGGVTAGLRVLAYTGAPLATITLADENKRPVVNVPAFSDERSALFFRVDARIEKRWRVSETASVAVMAEWLNATLSREQDVVCADTNIENGIKLRCQTAPRPVLSVPSVAIEGRF
jgi:hypothetical protein